MTTEEIYNGNVEIAKMLGEFVVDVWFTNANGDYYLGKCYTPHRGDKQHFCGAQDKKYVLKTISDRVQHFHKDWVWLMEAVEFIEKLPGMSIMTHKLAINTTHSIEILYDECNWQPRPTKDFSIFIRNESKILAWFIAISQFAKMYNNKLV